MAQRKRQKNRLVSKVNSLLVWVYSCFFDNKEQSRIYPVFPLCPFTNCNFVQTRCPNIVVLSVVWLVEHKAVTAAQAVNSFYTKPLGGHAPRVPTTHRAESD